MRDAEVLIVKRSFKLHMGQTLGWFFLVFFLIFVCESFFWFFWGCTCLLLLILFYFGGGGAVINMLHENEPAVAYAPSLWYGLGSFFLEPALKVHLFSVVQKRKSSSQ